MITIHKKEMWITVVTITICCFVLFACQARSENDIGDANRRPTPTQTTSQPSSAPIQTIPQPSGTPTRTNPKPTNTSGLGQPVFECAGPPEFDFIYPYIVKWTPDGAHLVISDVPYPEYPPSVLRVIDGGGSEIRTLVEANPEHGFIYGFYADVSPSNSTIVYSSCEYKTKVDIAYTKYWDEDLTGLNYEIATIAFDGSSKTRLTENEFVDHVPSWSPDGSEIAFVTEPRRWRVGLGGHLYLMRADGSFLRRLAPSIDRVTFWPPRWTPDGRYLAFGVTQGLIGPGQRKFLHTYSLERNDLTFITETSSLPAWSPDGERIAFGRRTIMEVGFEEKITEVGLYATTPDGRILRKLWSDDSFVADIWDPVNISQISWSPLGTEIAFVFADSDVSEVFVLNVENGAARRLGDELGCHVWGYGTCEIALDWSPDGSMIAVYYPGERLVLVSSDGSNVRTLAESIEGGPLETLEPNQ